LIVETRGSNKDTRFFALLLIAKHSRKTNYFLES
jgi:hypothetical protein